MTFGVLSVEYFYCLTGLKEGHVLGTFGVQNNILHNLRSGGKSIWMSYSPFSQSGSNAKSRNSTQLQRGGVIADALEEIFSGRNPDEESILNLHSSKILINSSSKKLLVFQYIQTTLCVVSNTWTFYLAVISNIQPPIDLKIKPGGNFIQSELICKSSWKNWIFRCPPNSWINLQVKLKKAKFSGVRQIHDRRRRGANEGGAERGFPDLRQRGEHFKKRTL